VRAKFKVTREEQEKMQHSIESKQKIMPSVTVFTALFGGGNAVVADFDSVRPCACGAATPMGSMQVALLGEFSDRKSRRRGSSQNQRLIAGAYLALPVGSVVGAKSNKGGGSVVLSASKQNTEQHRCNAV